MRVSNRSNLDGAGARFTEHRVHIDPYPKEQCVFLIAFVKEVGSGRFFERAITLEKGRTSHLKWDFISARVNEFFSLCWNASAELKDPRVVGQLLVDEKQ